LFYIPIYQHVTYISQNLTGHYCTEIFIPGRYDKKPELNLRKNTWFDPSRVRRGVVLPTDFIGGYSYSSPVGDIIKKKQFVLVRTIVKGADFGRD